MSTIGNICGFESPLVARRITSPSGKSNLSPELMMSSGGRGSTGAGTRGWHSRENLMSR